MLFSTKLYLIFGILCCKMYSWAETNFFFHAPQGSGMGLFLALALPIDIMNRDVFLAYNFEVNYNIPGNSTEDINVEYPPVVPSDETKTIKRNIIYDILEVKLKEVGLDGRQCLLKLICEFCAANLIHNGILSDLFHVILLPSSSAAEEPLHIDFIKAEMDGNTQNCSSYKQCSFNFLNIFSDYLNN